MYIICEFIAKDNLNSKLNANLWNSPWLCVIKVCSNAGAAYINSKLIAKANLNIAIVMQTFENLILQNCLTEFYDIAHTWSLGMCN